MTIRTWTALNPRLMLAVLIAALASGCADGPVVPSADDAPVAEARGAGKGGTGVSVSAVDPDTVPNDTILTVAVLGSGFTEGSAVTWELSGTPTSAVTTLPPVVFVSAQELRARISVARDAPLTTYDAVVTVAGGKRGIGVEKLLVVAKPVLLPLPDGIVRSTATDVNDRGVVVGVGHDGSDRAHALRWTPTNGGWAVEELEAGAQAEAVNDAGHVILWHRRSDGSHWWDILTPAGTRVVPEGSRSLTDINDAGTVIGRLETGWAVWLLQSPESWGTPRQIPVPDGYTRLMLNKINARNDIAGNLYDGDRTEWAAIWLYRNGTWEQPVLLAPTQSSHAMTLNDQGAVAGGVLPCFDQSCVNLPAYWDAPGSPTRILEADYGDTWNTRYGFVSDMNNAGRVVGEAPVRVGKRRVLRHPVVWPSAAGHPIDLGALNQPFATGLSVRAINNAWPSVAVGSASTPSGAAQAAVWYIF